MSESEPPTEPEPQRGELRIVVSIAAFCLGSVMMAMVGAMIKGLFDPQVDNGEIFKIMGPAFQTIIGCFVGMVSTLFVTRQK